ncbi:conjugal transfer protein [Streptomyces sp. NBC_01260]|uniref:conjugal transfer protein n=1 Tax=Streptomyces sp. NBC_01260 TaxID=2903801 RepID=UPI002E32861B|nr:conjugal transfer protein [Streptomyces sp. NBC_01260]
MKKSKNTQETAVVTEDGTESNAPRLRKLTRMQRGVLITAIVPMIAVGAAGGVGTYTNISGKYGSGTAVGALAAGEGATAVLALVLLVTTLLGQSAPLLVRAGLWALPAAAAAMGATAATGIGQALVYGLTPMAITASAEGIAFLSRRVVIHQEGRDVEAEARSAAIVRDLAYHQARAASHPDKKVRARSVKKSWKLARHVGTGDVRLGADLMDIQRERIGAGANAALSQMFGGTSDLPALTSATTRPALPAASADDVMDSRAQESTIPADGNGRPTDTGSDQAEEGQNIRPDLQVVRTEPKKKRSMRADVFGMVADGVQDVRTVLDAIATRHNRDVDDPATKSTVTKYFREAKADAQQTESAPVGQYL